mgnify:CR=1 FL=1
MDRLKKPTEFLTKLRLTDSDYMDSGMISHIADLLERYHQEQLILSGVSQQREQLNSFAEAWNVSMIKKEYILDSDIDRFIEIKTI